MKRWVLLTGVLVMTMMVMATGILPASAAPVTIRFSSGSPANHFITKQYIEWANLVEKNSNGDIKVQVYHSAQLFRDNEVIKAVQTGALEAGCAYAMYAENQLVPSMKVYQMPFLFNSMDEAMKVYRSEIGTEWKATAEKKGVKLLAMVSFPSPEAEIILSTKPVKTPADIKGGVIRAVSPESSAAIKKWGAGPSFLTGAEVYLALQRNTINGAVNSLTTYMERKLYEVAPHAIFLPSISVQTFIAMNKGVFDRMTPAQQKAVLDASAAIEGKTVQVARVAFKNDLEEAKKKAKLYTPTTAELALWKDGMVPIWEDTANKNKDVAAALKKVRAMLNR